MTRLVIEALVLLIRTEWLLQHSRDRALQDVLIPARSPDASVSPHSRERICDAVNIACTLWIKAVLCLQRSVTLVILLRRNSYPAELVIGAQTLPFRSHAWVELNGQVMNDRAYVGDLYHELERC